MHIFLIQIRCIVNMKGPERVETLESNINEFVRASRGLPTSSAGLINLIPSTIGAIDKKEVRATMIPSETNLLKCEASEETIDPPIPLHELVVKNKDQSFSRRRVPRRASCSQVGVTIDQSSDDESEQAPIQNHSLLDHGHFGKIVLTGIIQPSNSGVSVYRGRSEDESLESNPIFYAIKMAICWTDFNLEILQEMSREASVAQSLDHPNICKLLDALVAEHFVCLSYGYCSNGSLSSLLADLSKTYDFLDLALDISMGMAYLHSKNIIHRDLKPSNIILTNEGRAKITDFGLSITDNGGAELTGETGTYRWMAPEIIRHEKYSINSDTYSFGIILWQLVTRNTRPFTDLQPIQTAFAVAQGQRPEIPDSVSEHISRIIKVCWHHDQLCRPSFTNVSISLAQFGSTSDEKDPLETSNHSHDSNYSDRF